MNNYIITWESFQESYDLNPVKYINELIKLFYCIFPLIAQRTHGLYDLLLVTKFEKQQYEPRMTGAHF